MNTPNVTLPHPLRWPAAALSARYNLELLALISLIGTLYGSFGLAGFQVPTLSQMGHFVTLYPYHIVSLTGFFVLGTPVIFLLLPVKQKNEWALSYIPCALRLIGLLLRTLFSVALDLLQFPAAIGLVIMAKVWRSNFDPKDVKKDRIPILLIHGNDFNETEWIFGRPFLNKDAYGSVFTLNYDSLIRHDQTKGPEDYARTEIADKVTEILHKTRQTQINLIGHSMGGLIAADYAENIAPEKVKSIISIATPWQGAPLLNVLHILPWFSSKRYQHMTPDSDYLKNLNKLATESIKNGTHAYYNIYSTVDVCVPNTCGLLTDALPENHIEEFGFLGHLTIVTWPGTWLKIRQFLDQIYMMP